MKKAILFDLDGTLTKSDEGIIKSVQYALKKMNQHVPHSNELKEFIGPPLLEQFMEYSHFDKQKAKEAILYYRERYTTKGIYENELYPHAIEMLEQLKQKNILLAISSSKPEPFVNQIVRYFEIDHLFDAVVGSTMKEQKTGKSEVIFETLKRLNIDSKQDRIVMVGDRKHDIIGAKDNQLSCIAVSYGYGTCRELEINQPEHIVNSTIELTRILMQM